MVAVLTCVTVSTVDAKCHELCRMWHHVLFVITEYSIFGSPCTCM